MNSEDSIGLIELGNTNLKCLIFKINNDNNSEILSVPQHLQMVFTMMWW